jgi:two-component system LytT family sensor kinase
MVTAYNELYNKPVISQGKLRWRQHELIFVTLFVVVRIAGYIWDLLNSEQQFESTDVIPYAHYHLHFNYYKNLLLPQVGSVLLLYGCYLAVNLVIVRLLRKLSFKAETAVILRKILLAMVIFCLISWLLAWGINVATYYARPWFFNYGGFQFLAFLGYNDHPLESVWTGFDRALYLVGIFCLVAGIREVIIQYVERPGPGRSYRVLVLNQLSMAGVFYWSCMAVILVFNIFSGPAFRILYICFIPATFLVFMANTYWLFPQREGLPLFSFKTLLQLLVSSFLCTFPFFTFDGVYLQSKLFVFFMICWGMQLFITTPISWLIYRQRKDRILQLRNMEKEVVRSKADLQFLRSQINPHFLFNALNTLYGTALREKAPDTAEGIQKLGDMMRFMLHENTLDFIPMNREIEYLGNYIALQKLRTHTSPEIIIEDNIPEQSCNHIIAPMILIPFVENAFKHGISLREKSWIHISLTCEEKLIRFEVRNSVHPRPQNDPERSNAGIGLKNVMERLALVYPGKHEIKVTSNEKEFIVHLTIQP